MNTGLPFDGDLPLNFSFETADILNMNDLKNIMISKAAELYTDVYPVISRSDLRDCFTTQDNMLMFWFNTADETTHLLTIRIS